MKRLLTTALSLIAMVMASQAAVRLDVHFKTEPYTLQKWEGDYLSLGNMDLSQYDYIWVKYSGCDGTMRFALRYSEFLRIGENGVVFDERYATLAKGNGVAGIILDHKTKMVNGYKRTEDADGLYKGETYSKHCNEVFIQSQELVHVTIEGVYAGTAEEYFAALTDGRETMEIELDKMDDGEGVRQADGSYTYTFKTPFGDLANRYWGAIDLSKYATVIIELGQPTSCYMQAQMQYNDAKDASSMGISKDNMRFVLNLDPEKAKKSYQFFLQSSKAGSEVNVKKIILLSK